MPLDYPWTVEEIIDDYVKLVDHLGIQRFHLVGAKIGGALGYRLATTYPERVLSLTVTGARAISGRKSMGGRGLEVRAQIERDGVESWARATMPSRLGPNCPPELAEGFVKLMVESTPLSTQLGFMTKVPGIDVMGDLPHIKCPTLVIMNEGSGQASVEEARAGQARIPRSELVVLPGDSYHVAVTHANECARGMLDFLDRSMVTASAPP
jgi:3-oxoadipate enol-lactonase